MIRLPCPDNEDETKRRIADVRNTFILFGVMVIVIRLMPPVLRFINIQ